MPMVLDFDGVLTNVEEEGKPFVEGYTADLARMLRRPVRDVAAQLDLIVSNALQADPARFGWIFGKDGCIMAPAQVDPYLRTRAAARELIDLSAIMGTGATEPFLELLFGYNYSKTENVPKPGAAFFLSSVSDRRLPAAIISNSGTGGVTRKIASMLSQKSPAYEWWRARTFGDARKMDPDEYIERLPNGELIADPKDEVRWDPTLPKTYRLNGFPRDTVIKRPYYLKRLCALKAVWEIDLGRPLAWADFLVVGDIFELDLALPLLLGCHVGFMVNEHSPKWEVAHIGRFAHHGRILNSVDEILPFYDECISPRVS